MIYVTEIPNKEGEACGCGAGNTVIGSVATLGGGIALVDYGRLDRLQKAALIVQGLGYVWKDGEWKKSVERVYGKNEVTSTQCE